MYRNEVQHPMRANGGGMLINIGKGRVSITGF